MEEFQKALASSRYAGMGLGTRGPRCRRVLGGRRPTRHRDPVPTGPTGPFSNGASGTQLQWGPALCRTMVRLTEQIKQHLARLGKSCPEKSAESQENSRAQNGKISKILKIKPSRPKCREGQIHSENTTQNSKSPNLGPKSQGSVFPCNFGAQECPIWGPLWANRALFTRFGQIALLILFPYLYCS